MSPVQAPALGVFQRLHHGQTTNGRSLRESGISCILAWGISRSVVVHGFTRWAGGWPPLNAPRCFDFVFSSGVAYPLLFFFKGWAAPGFTSVLVGSTIVFSLIGQSL